MGLTKSKAASISAVAGESSSKAAVVILPTATSSTNASSSSASSTSLSNKKPSSSTRAARMVVVKQNGSANARADSCKASNGNGVVDEECSMKDGIATTTQAEPTASTVLSSSSSSSSSSPPLATSSISVVSTPSVRPPPPNHLLSSPPFPSPTSSAFVSAGTAEEVRAVRQEAVAARENDYALKEMAEHEVDTAIAQKAQLRKANPNSVSSMHTSANSAPSDFSGVSSLPRIANPISTMSNVSSLLSLPFLADSSSTPNDSLPSVHESNGSTVLSHSRSAASASSAIASVSSNLRPHPPPPRGKHTAVRQRASRPAPANVSATGSANTVAKSTIAQEAEEKKKVLMPRQTTYDPHTFDEEFGGMEDEDEHARPIAQLSNHTGAASPTHLTAHAGGGREQEKGKQAANSQHAPFHPISYSRAVVRTDRGSPSSPPEVTARPSLGLSVQSEKPRRRKTQRSGSYDTAEAQPAHAVKTRRNEDDSPVHLRGRSDPFDPPSVSTSVSSLFGADAEQSRVSIDQDRMEIGDDVIVEHEDDRLPTAAPKTDREHRSAQTAQTRSGTTEEKTWGNARQKRRRSSRDLMGKANGTPQKLSMETDREKERPTTTTISELSEDEQQAEAGQPSSTSNGLSVAAPSLPSTLLSSVLSSGNSGGLASASKTRRPGAAGPKRTTPVISRIPGHDAEASQLHIEVGVKHKSAAGLRGSSTFVEDLELLTPSNMLRNVESNDGEFEVEHEHGSFFEE